MTIKIKAAGNMVLDCLAIPFGGPNDKDLDGEYFTRQTDLHLDKFTDPLILYHHGHGQDRAEVIGQSLGHDIKKDGVWLKVQLDKANQYARRVWQAAKRGMCAASSGTVAHLMRKTADGFIADWPLIELSLFDIDKSKKRLPVNRRAIALPAAKALYSQAGRDFPDLPAEEPISDAEKKALKAEAIRILAEAEIENKYRERAFGRPPTDIERQYEAAAIGAVAHFGNTHLKSFPVRFMEVMPDGAKGAQLAGLYEVDDQGNPRILLRDRGDAAAEYLTFRHECGHSIDAALRGDERFEGDSEFSKAVREGVADKYRDLIGWFAFDQARRQFYGGKLSVKSIPINKLLEALK